MPWNDTTKIMTAPLNINTRGDIQKATEMLGHGDLGDCIVNGTINKWAKWKPQDSGLSVEPVGYLADDQRRDSNWGLTIPSALRRLSTVVEGYDAGNNYKYTRPARRFRMFDFVRVNNGVPSTSEGYYGNAKGFVSGNKAETNAASKKDHYYIHHISSGVICGVDWYRASRNDEIGLADLNLGLTSAINGYFGVILFDTSASSNKYRLICSDVKIQSSSSSSVTIPDSVFTPASQSLVGHTFKVYPVISLGNENATGEGLQTDMVNWDLISLPDVTIFMFDVRDAGQSVSVAINNLQSHINVLGRQTASCSISVRQTADLPATDVTFRIRLYGGGTTSTATTRLDESFETVSVSTYTTTINKSWGNSFFPSRYEAVKVTVEATAITTYVWEKSVVATNDDVN